MEILRQNPVNLYSFVGLITVPSNQKTGHKKLNKYDDVFSKKVNKNKPNIDYILMSTVMKYLKLTLTIFQESCNSFISYFTISTSVNAVSLVVLVT
jgi:hypothetical protein